MNSEINFRINSLLEEHPKWKEEGYFALLISESLVWSDYIKNSSLTSNKFVYRYFIKGENKAFSACMKYAGRFGPEVLSDTLRSLKLLYDSFAKSFTYRIPEDNILPVQEKFIRLWNDYRQREQISGVGFWLITAPFKMLLINRAKSFKKDTSAIILPAGLQVVRGARLLKKRGYSFTRNLILSSTSPSEQLYGLNSDEADTYSIHNMTRNMAELIKSKPVHLNSGLWLVGKKELQI